MTPGPGERREHNLAGGRGHRHEPPAQHPLPLPPRAQKESTTSLQRQPWGARAGGGGGVAFRSGDSEGWLGETGGSRTGGQVRRIQRVGESGVSWGQRLGARRSRGS